MRSFFEPASAPPWLKQVLSSVRAALGDVWDVPLRLWRVETADQPDAAGFTGGLDWDGTVSRVAYSDGSAWLTLQPYDATLAALAGLDASAGLLAQTGADAFAKRVLQAPAAGLTIANPAGIAGNPTFALANDLAALEALSGTNTIYYRSAADSWTAVTIGGLLSFAAGTLNIGSTTGSGTTVALADGPTFTGTLTCGTLTATGDVNLGDAAADTITLKGNVKGQADDVCFGLDGPGTSPRVGFTKKSGALAKLTFGSASSLAIAQSSAADIVAAGTFTDIATFDGTGLNMAAAKKVTLSGAGSFGTALSGTALLYHSTTIGLVVAGAGTTADLYLANKSGSQVMQVLTGTVQADFGGALTTVGNVTVGTGGTGSGTLSITLNGPSGTGGGPYIAFQKNGAVIGYAGSDSAINGGTSNNLVLFATSNLTLHATGGTVTVEGIGKFGAGQITTGTVSLRIETTGAGGPPSGATGQGIEFFQTGMQSFNRTTSAYGGFNIDASTINLRPSGSVALAVSATLVTASKPVVVPSFTVAGVPTAATAGQVVYVSNETGGAVLAFADGTNWRRVTDRAVIA
jgi:hypothetical protein